MPEDRVISEVSAAGLAKATTIKIPDQKEAAYLWGVNIQRPDGRLVSVEPLMTRMIYESREREETLSRLKAEGDFLIYEFNNRRPLSRSIDLARLYDFPLTGTYRVQFVYDNGWLNDFTDGKWVGSFGSRAFEVTIK